VSNLSEIDDLASTFAKVSDLYHYLDTKICILCQKGHSIASNLSFFSQNSVSIVASSALFSTFFTLDHFSCIVLQQICVNTTEGNQVRRQ
jgi:hypothetical protein